MLETTGEVIDKSILNVEGGNFYAPTMSEEEHNISFLGNPAITNFDVNFERSSFIKSVL